MLTLYSNAKAFIAFTFFQVFLQMQPGVTTTHRQKKSSDWFTPTSKHNSNCVPTRC